MNYVWGMTGMDKLIKVLLLRIVSTSGARATIRLQSQKA